MKGRRIRMHFHRGQIFLLRDMPMTYRQIGYCEVGPSNFRDAYWDLEILNFSEVDGRLFCKVLSYKCGKQEIVHYSDDLCSMLRLVHSIDFNNIDTDGLFRTLGPVEEISLGSYTGTPAIFNNIQIQQPTIDTAPSRETLSFSCDLKKAEFVDHGVWVPFKGDGQWPREKYFIENEHIRKEFDVVKKYIEKVLLTNRLQVNVVYIKQYGSYNIESIACTQVDSIDETFVDQMRQAVFSGFSSNSKRNDGTTRVLLEQEEFLQLMLDETVRQLVGDVSESDLIDKMLQSTVSKHAPHLGYLAKQHETTTMRLRFCAAPISFLFLLMSNEHYFFVWETYDTEQATFIWKCKVSEGAARRHFEVLHEHIREIEEHGRRKYIKKAGQDFHRLVHDYSGADKGFGKWKEELNGFMERE